MASVGDRVTTANVDRGNTSPSSGYFEQRSPKYLSQSHQISPSSTSSAASSSARKFVFDAVSPRHESVGEYDASVCACVLACMHKMIQPN